MRKIIWIFAAIAMTVLSCSKQENGGEITPPDNGQEIEKIYLKINSASVEQTGEEPTKAAIKETKFPTEQEVSVGLFVVGEGYTDAKYGNIKCTKPAGSDKFSDPKIPLIEGKTATVYAYYPFDENIAKTSDAIKSIPVKSSVCGDDWMWATPIENVSKTNPTVDLKFNHALALVEITFNISGPEGTMTNVTIAGGAGAFSKAGTMNAIDGAITPDDAQMATKDSPFSQEINLTLTDGKIAADCLLVPGKTGTDADARQDFYVKCTYNGKTYSASLSGNEKGVIVRKNTKSIVSLNVKDNKLEVVSVGVVPWTDSNVSGNTATLDGYTVTFNCPEDMKYELCIEAESTAIPGESTQGGNPTVILRYDVSSVPDYRFVFNGAATSCTVSYDWQNGIITVKDVTKDVTVNLDYGTYIKYTASEKVTPNKTDAFGFTYDEDRSTFNKGNGSGVVAIDGILTTIGDEAFYGTSISGIIIPEGVTGIGKSAFDDCLELVSVTFPSTLTSIGNNAFQEMGNESAAAKQPLVLPSSLSSIGQFAFENAKIESVTLPSGLKTVGESAFKTSTLETLVIEDGAVLGKKMFNNCGELKTVTSKSTTPPAAYHNGSGFVFAKVTDVITALANLENIYVPSSSVDTYKSDYGWSIYKDKISAIPSQD